MQKHNVGGRSGQPIKDQEQKIIEVLVKQAIDALYANDIFLLENDAHERTITHKLAEYLQDAFENWYVDLEYDKYYQESSRLQEHLPRHGKMAGASHAESEIVYPDIIVHGRGTGFSLLVAEVCKSTSARPRDYDMEKLRQYKNELHCKHAFLLVLCCGDGLRKGDERYQMCWV